MPTPQFFEESDIESDAVLTSRPRVVRRMLEVTGRGGVPIRSDFVQLRKKDEKGSRHGLLAKFTTDVRALDAYLLIHALASSKAPYAADYPGAIWVRASGFDASATVDSARQRWSKAIGKLAGHKLISTSRNGRQAVYTLLHELGDGEPYTRPKNIRDGGWVTLPYRYWTDGLDEQLTHAEKLMLLISLDQKTTFQLPAARVEEWYGVSESTARRGFAGLEKRGMLEIGKKNEIDLQSASMLRTVNTYTLLGDWTLASRKKAMTVKRGRPSRTTTYRPKAKATASK